MRAESNYPTVLGVRFEDMIESREVVDWPDRPTMQTRCKPLYVPFYALWWLTGLRWSVLLRQPRQGLRLLKALCLSWRWR